MIAIQSLIQIHVYKVRQYSVSPTVKVIIDEVVVIIKLAINVH